MQQIRETEKTDKIKIAMLLSDIEAEVLERYNHFTWPEAVNDNKESNVPSKNVYEDILSRFYQELAGMKRIIFNSFKVFGVQPIRETRLSTVCQEP